MSGYAVITGSDMVRLERVLPGPIERVWHYLTDSEKRGQWLAGGTMDLRIGGKVELQFHHVDLSPEKVPTPERYRNLEGGHSVVGVITACEPPRLLSYSWGGAPDKASEVTFELSSREGTEVLLVITHRRLADRAQMANVASGWHAHVGILDARLRGQVPGNFWLAHARMEAEYTQRFETERMPACDVRR